MDTPLKQDESCGDDAPTTKLQRTSSLRSHNNILVSRPIFNQDNFGRCEEARVVGKANSPWKKFKRRINQKASKIRHWHPTIGGLLLATVKGLFPVLSWLPKYQIRRDLPKDLLSGSIVWIMSIPAGMAYSLLASMPAIFGLYTSFFPSLIYSVMATSKHVSIGVFAIVSIMTGKVVQQYALPNRAVSMLTAANISIASSTRDVASDVTSHLESRIAVMICVTLAVGIWQVLMGTFGLGYMGVYLSDQLVTGFTAGTAVHVLTSQLKSIFGLRRMRDFNGPLKIIYTWVEFFSAIRYTHFPTLIISAVCLNFLLLIKYGFNENKWTQSHFPCHIHLPGELLTVIFGILASYYLDLGHSYGVDIVGFIPLGLPKPRVPDLSILPAFAMDTFAIAIVSFAVQLSFAKMYSMKHKYPVDPNQELRALGCGNIFGGFFQCLPSSAFLGRVATQASVGGESQVVSIFAAGLMLIVLLFLGNLLEPLPKACLGCIIAVALIGIFKDIRLVWKLSKISAMDASVFLISLLAVVILDVDIGLALAVGWSLLTVVLRTQRPDVPILGRALHTDIYRRVNDYKSVAEVDGCKIIGFNAPLYFANADYFLRKVRAITHLNQYHFPDEQQNPTPKQVKDHDSPTIPFTDNQPPVPHHSILALPKFHLPHLHHHTTSQEPSIENEFVTAVKPDGTTITDAATWTAGYFDQPIKHIILDCSSISFIDINGVQAVKDLAGQCAATNMTFFLASCKPEVIDMLMLCGYSKDLTANHIFMHVHDAVIQALRDNEGWRGEARRKLVVQSCSRPINLSN
ncbi:Solute carrier family 26 member 6 [Hypsibius exemplaris]|uniref:Solute carrier family 26 member 6 n=1 Tax=Hypsibius exemplaris TaxID=2072580 RepID=A0A1W0WEK2_HYPEX|nr:Solute carrier family 26 member 6 [Hypsibius exemplaris]